MAEKRKVSCEPSRDALALWSKLGKARTSRTARLEEIIESLEAAKDHFLLDSNARRFVEKYLRFVLLDVLNQDEQNLEVNRIFQLCVAIVEKDIKAKMNPSSGECSIINLIAMMGSRIHNISSSWVSALAPYFKRRAVENRLLPSLEILSQLVAAVHEAEIENAEDGLSIVNSITLYLQNMSEECVQYQVHDDLQSLLMELKKLVEKLATNYRRDIYVFYNFWREFVYFLMNSRFQSLQDLGWNQMQELIGASSKLRPLPDSITIAGAGSGEVNGTYFYMGETTDDGFHKPGGNIFYEIKRSSSQNQVPGDENSFYLQRIKSLDRNWWVITKAEGEQKYSTSGEVDYYYHKSLEIYPPTEYWSFEKGDEDVNPFGVGPAPIVSTMGSELLIPPDEKYNTIEHQLAKWVIEKRIIEDSVESMTTSKTLPLIEFLLGLDGRENILDIKSPLFKNEESCKKLYNLRTVLHSWKAFENNLQTLSAKQFCNTASQDSCFICFNENPNIATLCCGKAVHHNCLHKWLVHNKACPICRRRM